MSSTTQQTRTAEVQFEFVIRLQPFKSGPPTEGVRDLRWRAQALVSDTLSNRLAVATVVSAQDYVHTWGLNDLGKALAASRALQVAFEGFRSAANSSRAHISVVLDTSAPDEALSAHPGPSLEQKELLDAAKPSQVLVTQAFYDRIAQYQPALRSFPARAGVYEFLWTSEERLSELQAAAEFMPTLVMESAPATGAAAAAPAAPAAVAEDVQAAQAAQGTWRPKHPRTSDPDHEEGAPQLSRPRIIAISSAALVLFGLGASYLLMRHDSPAHPRAVTATAPSAAARKTAAVTIVDPAKPAVNPAPAVTLPAPTKPTAKRTTATSTGVLSDGKATTPPLGGSKPVARGCSISGLIPNYLAMAETSRNNGQYDAAIRQYTQVLDCEPGNREARDGLQRTKDGERLSGVTR